MLTLKGQVGEELQHLNKITSDNQSRNAIYIGVHLSIGSCPLWSWPFGLSCISV